ncbi:MAG: hypothetical protein UHM08_08810 [Bacteroidales bacterium]|nr:hypothetical protein [Bacteroidales bacterium]
MNHRVHEIPSYEEFFGLVDNIIEDDEFNPKHDDEDVQKLLVIVLGLLQEFYIEYMYANEYDIASEEFKEKIDKFNDELQDSLAILLAEYVENVNFELSLQYNMPLVTLEKEMLDLKRDIELGVRSSVDAVTKTLYYDLKDKADFYKEMTLTTGVFSPHSNFRRAIKKLTNAVDFKTHYAKARADRVYLEFVYGQEALFVWNVTGVNTCAWCYEMASMGAMPLSWFPIDHINGRCWLTPVNPNEYSEEYKDIIGE